MLILIYILVFLIIAHAYYMHSMVKKLNKSIDEKESKMVGRLIEATKALSDLCRNAFDHIKSNSQKIDKANAKFGEFNRRLNQVDTRNRKTQNIVEAVLPKAESVVEKKERKVKPDNKIKVLGI